MIVWSSQRIEKLEDRITSLERVYDSMCRNNQSDFATLKRQAQEFTEFKRGIEELRYKDATLQTGNVVLVPSLVEDIDIEAILLLEGRGGWYVVVQHDDAPRFIYHSQIKLKRG